MVKNVRAESIHLLLRAFLVLFFLIGNIAEAQVMTNITSSGLGTVVTPSGNVSNITGGTRPGDGPNLFHSFGFFNIATGATANFFNETGLTTANILSRVTGGQASNIFGSIQTTAFGSANLFLMNPAGVIFGPTASVNIAGSFHVSTADYLRLGEVGAANAGVFSAHPLVADVLTIAPVAAFGFLNANPASIAVQGSTLAVRAGESISLMGGNRAFMTANGDTVPVGVTLTGGMLSAPGGKVQLVGVASPGEVLFPSLQFGPNVNGDTFSALGTVSLSSGATVDASGIGGIGSEAGGTVYIRGGQLLMDSAVILADTNGAIDGMPIALSLDVGGEVVLANSSVISASSATSGRAGDIQISGENITIDASFIATSTMDAPGGSISISAQNVSVNGGGSVSTTSAGAGDAGVITVLATGSILVGGMDLSSIFTEVYSAGNGGAINISASSLAVDVGAVRTSAFASGNAGNITIQVQNDASITGGGVIISSGGNLTSGTISVAADTLLITGQGASAGSRIVNENGGAGVTGEIVLNVRDFLLSDGARINSEGAGSHGKIAITATETATISNGAKIRMANDSGAGGLVDISAPVLTLNNGIIQTLTTGLGDAGAMQLHGDTVNLSSASLIDSSTSGAGRGGNIQIQANQVLFTGAAVSAKSTGGGDAGSISITTGSLVMGSGSAVDSGTSSSGRGGDININATGLLSISGTLSDGSPSGIFSRSVDAATGVGGNINLQANQVSLANGASVSAESTSVGNAGNVSIQAADSFSISNSTVTTSTTQSDGGNIAINAGNLVQLDHSEITTNVQGGAGSGGNISIDPPVVLLDASKIIASAIGGNGGNINIVAGVFLASPDSLIDASSTFGLSGAITIDSPIKNLSSTLAPLPQGFLQVAGLLQGRCAARFEGGLRSSLVVAGRDAIPVEPGDVLAGPIFSAGENPVIARGAVPGVRVSRRFKEPSSDHGLTLVAPDGQC